MTRTKEQARQYNLNYIAKNKDKIAERKKKYRIENKEKLNNYFKSRYQLTKDKRKEEHIKYYSDPNNRVKRILAKAKETAKKKGYEFNLEIGDIIIPEYCPYLGIKLTHTFGKGQLQSNSSIDRVDSSKGYIKGNIQIISRLANTMKSNATKEQLIEFSKNVLRLHG